MEEILSILIRVLLFRESEASRHLLDDMLNLIAEARGSVSAHHDLFFAYVEGGRPVEAGKVLKVSVLVRG